MMVRTPPKARPAAAIVAALLAIGLIAIGAVGIHDLLADQGVIAPGNWTRAVSVSLDGLTATAAVAAVAVVAVIAGLWLMLVSLKPGRHTHLRAPTNDADLWISRSALAALAVERAERVSAVTSADAHARRRRIRLDIRTTEPDATAAIDESVNTHLEGLTTPRVVKVRTRQVR
jgi:hypothetical protein